MMDWINSNMGTSWFILGCVLLVIEAFIFGMSTAVLLFAGFGAVITGLLLWVGIVPATWTASFAVFTISSAVSTALLWIPFKKLQSEPFQKADASSDLIGYEFTTDSALTSTESGAVRYSGIEWRVELDEDAGSRNIAAGEKVAVSSVSAGLFRVVPVTN